MNGSPVFISGAGIISSLGTGLTATAKALKENICAIRPLCIFPLLQDDPLPVGQVEDLAGDEILPRTHRLALSAAAQAMKGEVEPPDAVIIGTTTGGMLESEELLRTGVRKRAGYRYHGLSTVAEIISEKYHCPGPMLTVSTACSSGTVALALALKMLRMGRAERILVGGVDSLCRLTYFGFHSLQLVDRNGCHPLDANRQGMAVAEGAAMLLLTRQSPKNPLALLLGAGLSCDAYHPAAPQPQGVGALAAMQAALDDAGVSPSAIEYINLHGTGTRENDLAEARAVRALFADPPPLSSIKGATGHSLAAAGAIEAVVSALTAAHGCIPANTGLRKIDPVLNLLPVTEPEKKPVDLVLSNSFGFGGNNGSLVIGHPQVRVTSRPFTDRYQGWLAIHGRSCLTGIGCDEPAMQAMLQGKTVAGMADEDQICQGFESSTIRRLKRLPRMALHLARAAHMDSGCSNSPDSVFMGTGWGALSETHAFLTRLAETDERFPSPTDFVGSVHNSPAGQVAIMFGAVGANITTSGGNYSFEQALIASDLMIKDGETAFVLGADEYQKNLSPLFDPSAGDTSHPADGGGGFVVSRSMSAARSRMRAVYYGDSAMGVPSLVGDCGGTDYLKKRCGLVLAGIPAANREAGEAQLRKFMEEANLDVPVIRYRNLIGEFASASAVAAVLAAGLVEAGRCCWQGIVDQAIAPGREHIFVLGLGATITAMEFARP